MKDKESGGFVEKLVEIGKWLITPPPEPYRVESADWYSALSVTPQSFSNQLRNLYSSLNSTRPLRSPGNVLESGAIEFRSEPQSEAAGD